MAAAPRIGPAGLVKDFGASLNRPSLVRRLIVLAAAWSLALLVVAGVSLSAFFNHAAVNRFDDELSETVDGLVAGASAENGQVLGPQFSDPSTLRAYSGAYWEISKPDGSGLHALARSRSLWDRALPPPPGGAAMFVKSPGKVVYYDAPGPLHQKLRIGGLQGRLPDYPGPVVFMAAEDRTPIDHDAAAFETTVGIFLVLLGAGLVAAVVLQVRFGLQPLFALRREVAQVRTGRSERVTGRYPSELAPLAAELNALVAHNQEVVERQRTHVGNLAHALKTPLSVVLTEARSEPGRLAEVVSRQAETMSLQIDHHLRRARAAARAGGPGSAPRSRRCWRNSAGHWSASSGTRSPRSTGAATTTSSSRANGRTCWRSSATCWRTPANGRGGVSASPPRPRRKAASMSLSRMTVRGSPRTCGARFSGGEPGWTKAPRAPGSASPSSTSSPAPIGAPSFSAHRLWAGCGST